MSDAATRVLYVGGMGRSGSTLLELMLARVPGVVTVGELRYAWERGPVDNVLCSCRRRFRDCPFWQEVGMRAFGGWDRLDAAAVLELQRSVDRHRFIAAMLAPGRPRPFHARLGRYTDLLGRLYAAISETAGAHVVVDTTKDPPHAFILAHTPEVDLRLVHLIRDSRGVAFSWTKTVVRPEVVDAHVHMDRVRPEVMALKWVDYNLLFHALRRLGTPTAIVRYEDLIDDPDGRIGAVLAMAGVEPRSPLRFDGQITPDEAVHTLSGNPLRFSTGSRPLAVDQEWRTAMRPRDRRVVSALTWPMLRAYGYLPERDAGRPLTADHVA